MSELTFLRGWNDKHWPPHPVLLVEMRSC
jgi:hypothetical protein